MRAPLDIPRLRAFLDELSRAAEAPTRLYLTGGASQLLRGLRAATLDVDLTFEPESDELLRSMVRLKETLNVNVEIVSPVHDPAIDARSLSIAVDRFAGVDGP